MQPVFPVVACFLAILVLGTNGAPSERKVTPQMFLTETVIATYFGPTPRPGRSCAEHLASAKKGRTDTPAYPKCDADGTYSPMQILNSAPGNRDVQCVTKTGYEILSGPKIKSCECLRLRHEGKIKSDQHIVGHFVPSCDETTGEYSPRQMHGSTGMSWCVDATGKQKGEKIRGSPVGC